MVVVEVAVVNQPLLRVVNQPPLRVAAAALLVALLVALLAALLVVLQTTLLLPSIKAETTCLMKLTLTSWTTLTHPGRWKAPVASSFK